MSIVLLPAAAAAAVCHDEQLRIWAEEVVGALALAGFVREHMSYDDVIELHCVVQRELKQIIEAAFDHPEARTIKRQD